MTGGPDRKDESRLRESDLQDAIDRSDRELKLIANFYHQHGYNDCAQEIYQTMFKIRTERNQSDENAERQNNLSDRNESQD